MLLTFPIKGEFRIAITDEDGLWKATIYQFRGQEINQVSATDKDRYRAMGLAMSRLRKLLCDQELQERDTRPAQKPATIL